MENNQISNLTPSAEMEDKGTGTADFIRDLTRQALLVREGERTWRDVATYASARGVYLAEDTIRKGFKFAFDLYDAGMINLDEETIANIVDAKDAQESIDNTVTQLTNRPANKTINSDGTCSYDRLVVLYEGQEDLTEEQMLAFFNLKSDDWIVTSCKLQAWHGAIKGGGSQLLYNLRINVRPKIAKDFGLRDIQAFFERHQNGVESVEFEPDQAVADDKSGNKIIKQIDLADPHFGLLAWKPETGEHYDLHIAAKYTMDCFYQFVERNKNQKIDQIVLVTMGDVIHVDNGNLETTHGTRQDTEGRVPKMIDKAVATLVSAVRLLKTLHVPIKYVYVPGNHDQNLGYAVACLVKVTFTGDPQVIFDVEPTYYKCLEYGATSVIVTHGEAPNKRLPNELLTRHRDAYGRTGASEIHAGHLHTEEVEYVGPVKVRRVPAICESSYWEHSKGYPAVGRGMQAFTYWSKVPGCISVENYYTHHPVL